VPELSAIPIGSIHEPWHLTLLEQQLFNTALGRDYPHPMTDLFESARINEKIYTSAVALQR
jgi:deoxyribodipyrimidine photo-lyase